MDGIGKGGIKQIAVSLYCAAATDTTLTSEAAVPHLK